MKVLVIALLWLVAVPAAAQADTFTAAADSPRDSALPVGQDLSAVAASFDNTAGTLTIGVTLPGAPVTDASAAINGTLYGTAADGSCGTVIAFLRSTTNPASTEAMGTVTPTTSPRAAQTTTKTAAGPSITLAMTDPAFAGVTPGCLTLNLTNHGVKDAVESIPFTAQTPPPVATAPTPTPAPVPPAVRFAHPGAKLKASSTGTVAIALSPFTQPTSGTVSIRRAGRVVGHKRYTARPGAAVTVRVKLDAGSRRSLARGSTLSARITATAGTASRTTTAKIQRPRTRTRGE
jgi:hypothetical protein